MKSSCLLSDGAASELTNNYLDAQKRLGALGADFARALDLFYDKGGNGEVIEALGQWKSGKRALDGITQKVMGEDTTFDSFVKTANEAQMTAFAETVIKPYIEQLAYVGMDRTEVLSVAHESREFVGMYKAAHRISKTRDGLYYLNNFLLPRISAAAELNMDRQRYFEKFAPAKRAYYEWSTLKAFLEQKVPAFQRRIRDAMQEHYNKVKMYKDRDGNSLTADDFKKLTSLLGERGGETELRAELESRYDDYGIISDVLTKVKQNFDAFQIINIGMTKEQAEAVVAKFREANKGEDADMSDGQILSHVISSMKIKEEGSEAEISLRRNVANSIVRFYSEVRGKWDEMAESSRGISDRIGGAVDLDYLQRLTEMKTQYGYIPSEGQETEASEVLISKFNKRLPGIASFLRERDLALESQDYVAAMAENLNSFMHGVSQASTLTMINKMQDGLNKFRNSDFAQSDSLILKNTKVTHTVIQNFIDTMGKIVLHSNESPDWDITSLTKGISNASGFTPSTMLAMPTTGLKQYAQLFTDIMPTLGFKGMWNMKREIESAKQKKDKVALMVQEYARQHLESSGRPEEFVIRKKLGVKEEGKIGARIGKAIQDAANKASDYQTTYGLLHLKPLALKPSEDYLRSWAEGMLYDKVKSSLELNPEADVEALMKQHGETVFYSINKILGNFTPENKSFWTWAIDKGMFNDESNITRMGLAMAGSMARLWGSFRMIAVNHSYKIAEDLINATTKGNYFKANPGERSVSADMLAGMIPSLAIALYGLAATHDLIPGEEDSSRTLVPFAYSIVSSDPSEGSYGYVARSAIVAAKKIAAPFLDVAMSEQEFDDYISDSLRLLGGVLVSSSFDKGFKEYLLSNDENGNGNPLTQPLVSLASKDALFDILTHTNAPAAAYSMAKGVANDIAYIGKGEQKVSAKSKYEAIAQMRENLREMRDENLGDNYRFKASLVAHQVAELLAIETGGADKINSKWVKSLRKDTLNHMMLSMIGLGVHENPEFYDVKPYRTNKIASSIRDSQRELQYRLKQAEYERTGQLRNLQYLNNMIINYGKIFVR